MCAAAVFSDSSYFTLLYFTSLSGCPNICVPTIWMCEKLQWVWESRTQPDRMFDSDPPPSTAARPVKHNKHDKHNKHKHSRVWMFLHCLPFLSMLLTSPYFAKVTQTRSQVFSKTKNCTKLRVELQSIGVKL